VCVFPGHWKVGSSRCFIWSRLVLHHNFIRQRPHSGRYCYGKTPMQTFGESKHLAEAKMLDRQQALVGQSDSEAAVG